MGCYQAVGCSFNTESFVFKCFVENKMIVCNQWKLVSSILLCTALTMWGSADDMTYLKPPQFIGEPGNNHALIDRQFQGIPSLAVSPGGRLWATWYAGKTPDEDHNNYVVIATSGDHGQTWTETLVIDPDGDGPVRAFDPELWIDPDGKLWSFSNIKSSIFPAPIKSNHSRRHRKWHRSRLSTPV